MIKLLYIKKKHYFFSIFKITLLNGKKYMNGTNLNFGQTLKNKITILNCRRVFNLIKYGTRGIFFGRHT